MPASSPLWALALLMSMSAAPVFARSSDRNLPMDIDSASYNCGTGDNDTCKFIGDVVIIQGTLKIQSAAATIYRINGESNRAVFTGSPVKISQLLDNGSTFNANASNVDYNLVSDIVVMTGNVAIDQPGRGSMTGQKVTYNLKSGQVESGGAGNGRVKVTIQPKSKQAQAPTTGKPD